MDEGPAPERPARAPAGRRRRYKPRELELGDGGRLTLRSDGTIVEVDGTAQAVGSWTPDDPEWARHAIRFGLRPQDSTVAPHGPSAGTKPPRW